MQEIELICSCGKVQGKAECINSHSGNRIVCFCDDCRAFARFLGRESSVLDQNGGTELFQMPVSHLKFINGVEHVQCVRLSSKGMYRWYAACCNTAIGNTLGPGGPFIGVIHNFIDAGVDRDMTLGEIRGYVQTRFALGNIPPEHDKSSFKVTLRSLRKLLMWKLKGLSKPSAFFDSDGNPLSEPKILG